LPKLQDPGTIIKIKTACTAVKPLIC